MWGNEYNEKLDALLNKQTKNVKCKFVEMAAKKAWTVIFSVRRFYGENSLLNTLNKIIKKKIVLKTMYLLEY